jgi:spore coat polysaccharide biosynthesis predicted glycosyltransferase SpsG
MGGSDSAELTPTIVDAFDGFDITVDAVVGPGFSTQQEAEVRQAAADISATVRVNRDPSDLVARMHQADFAVSTASSTVYELLALWTPIICQPVADNQIPISTALDQKDAAIVLDQDAERHEHHTAIGRYITSPTLRETRQNRGRELVDTAGSIRVANAVKEICKM